MRLNSLRTVRSRMVRDLAKGTGVDFASFAIEDPELVLKGGVPVGRLFLGDGAGDIADPAQALAQLEPTLEVSGAGPGIDPGRIGLLDEQRGQERARGVVGEVGHEGLGPRLGTTAQGRNDRAQ